VDLFLENRRESSIIDQFSIAFYLILWLYIPAIRLNLRLNLFFYICIYLTVEEKEEEESEALKAIEMVLPTIHIFLS
jgi:hypothetical protein